MVSRKTPRRKAVVPLLMLFTITTFVAFVINVVAVSVKTDGFEAEGSAQVSSDTEGASEPEPAPEPAPEPTPDPIKAINLQTVVDDWVSSVGGNKGVIIYDLDRLEVIGEYNADKMFKTASLYKLFPVYEGYKRVEDGSWSPDTRTGWYGDTLIDCLDSAIRSSDSSCAEPIWAKVGHEEMDEIILNTYKINDAEISSLSASPRAIMLIMKRFYEHPDFKDEEMIARIWDSFLNQPISDGYNWRQGLPSGFSDGVLVYNKVGWQWSQEEDGSNGHWVIYDDAAILDFTSINRHFIVVVMTNNVRYQSIRAFGQMIEENVLENYNI